MQWVDLQQRTQCQGLVNMSIEILFPSGDFFNRSVITIFSRNLLLQGASPLKSASLVSKLVNVITISNTLLIVQENTFLQRTVTTIPNPVPS
jgi:hypothetical protein